MSVALETLPSGAPRRDLLSALGLFLLVGVASYASLRLTRLGGGVASVWVANGILAGVLLLGRRAWWRYWFVAAGLAQLIARLANAEPPLVSLGLVGVNLLECAIVAVWVRRQVPDVRRATSLAPLARAAFGSTLVACVVSATLALPLFLLRDGPQSALEVWSTWLMAHVLGMVIVATLVVCARQPRVRLLGEAGRRADYATSIGLLLGACAITFLQSRFPLLFLPYLPLLMLAWRHGLSGMVMGVLLLALASGAAATLGTGPFTLSRSTLPLEDVLFWQFYVAAGCVLAYSTTVAVSERRRLELRTQRSEARLLAITENLPAMVARFDRDGCYVYANPLSRRLAPGVDLVGKSLREIRGPERYARIAPHVDAVLRGERQEFDTTLDLDGEPVALHVQFVPDLAPDGSVQGFYSLSFDVTEARAAKEELERLATQDDLTGLANRRHFEYSLGRAVNRASRSGAALMLLALDLDRFKQINDTWGHAVGDAVLRVFAVRLKQSVFDVDLVARMGGDEFLVLVEYTPNASVGEVVAARVVEAMRMPMRIGDHVIPVSCSIGIGVHQPVESGERLLALADEALYAAKAAGRDTWAVRAG